MPKFFSSVSAPLSRIANVALATAILPTLFMLCGDSQTIGGATAQNDQTLAWRGVWYSAMRAKRGQMRLLGRQTYGLHMVDASTPVPLISDLGDWHCSATGGYTLAQIRAEALACEAEQGVPHVASLLGGENDIAAGVAAGHTASQIASDVLAGMVGWVQDRLAANPLMLLFVMDLCPHGKPLSDYVSRNAVRDLVNSGMAAALAPYPNVTLVKAGSKLSVADLDGSGNHPAGYANGKLGRALAEAMLGILPPAGMAWPRKCRGLVPVARKTSVEQSGNAFAADDGTKGIIPVGYQSFSFGIKFRPTDLSAAYQRNIMSFGPGAVAVSNTVSLLHGPAVAGHSQQALQLYINGVGAFSLNDALALNLWHAITVSVRVLSPTAAEATIYCVRAGKNGEPIQTCVSQIRNWPGFAAWSISPGYMTVGVEAALGIYYGLVGAWGDVWSAPGYVATEDDALAFYSEGDIPGPNTAYWPCNDGSGTTAAVAPGLNTLVPGLTVDNNWSAAGAIHEPWHRLAADGPRHGTFNLNGATPFDVTVLGMRAGDEHLLTFTRGTMGGTPGQFAASCGTDKFTVTGTALDTSAVSWRFAGAFEG